MIWSVDTDDFNGSCHGVRYPLLTEIERVLCGGVIVSTIKNKIQQQYFYNLCCTCRSTNLVCMHKTTYIANDDILMNF